MLKPSVFFTQSPERMLKPVFFAHQDGTPFRIYLGHKGFGTSAVHKGHMVS
jgi:hypothetical protein